MIETYIVHIIIWYVYDCPLSYKRLRRRAREEAITDIHRGYVCEEAEYSEYHKDAKNIIECEM